MPPTAEAAAAASSGIAGASAIGAAGLILARHVLLSLTLAGNTILSQIGFCRLLRDRAWPRSVMAMFFSPSSDRAHREPRRAGGASRPEQLPRAGDPGPSPAGLGAAPPGMPGPKNHRSL